MSLEERKSADNYQVADGSYSSASSSISESIHNASDAVHVNYTKTEEKKVIRKLDTNVLLYLCVVYGLAYLDRNSFGNAYNNGMGIAVGMTDNEWLWLNTIFYLAFISTQWLSMFWKIIPPKRYVPVFIILWATCSCLHCIANWPGMMVLRFTMGVCESAFTTVSYYLTMFYYRKEMKRIGWFMAVAPLSASVSGLLGYGITSHVQNFPAWKVLFLVQGIPVFIAGVWGLWGLPTDINDCRFLNKREKQIGNSRASKQLGIVSREDQHKLIPSEVIKVLLSPMVVMTAIIAFSYNACSGYVTFFPIVMKDMGFTGAISQALVSPPNLVSAGVILLGSFLSDLYLQRGLFMILFCTTASIGYLVMALCTNAYIRYGGIYLVAIGGAGAPAIMLTWLGSIYGTDTKRAVGYASMGLIGQSGTILASRLYPATDSPRYQRGLFISFGFMVLGTILVLTLRSYLNRLNRKLDKNFGKAVKIHGPDDSIALEGEANPNFRYVL